MKFPPIIFITDECVEKGKKKKTIFIFGSDTIIIYSVVNGAPEE